MQGRNSGSNRRETKEIETGLLKSNEKEETKTATKRLQLLVHRLPLTLFNHVTVSQYCLPSAGWIQPVLAADSVFSFTRLYFATRQRW